MNLFQAPAVRPSCSTLQPHSLVAARRADPHFGEDGPPARDFFCPLPACDPELFARVSKTSNRPGNMLVSSFSTACRALGFRPKALRMVGAIWVVSTGVLIINGLSLGQLTSSAT